ncbi:acyl-CoA dehydrogenase family protein [Curtobacterium sp. S6]|uniref:acyl-CoA dehydrogenase family protein n=1 Tax=Curtobacterium sp. S6 TaxID=1479623 RepID=UPI000A4C3EC3|nr:acyl-CoA dehydrogenase family protein [Curtobacterium sp. S6]
MTATHPVQPSSRFDDAEAATGVPALADYPERDLVVRLAAESAARVDEDDASPFETLRRLGELGLLTRGREGSLLPQAAVIYDLATECMSTAFSLWAHRSTIAFFDAVGRPLPEGLADGSVTGSTAMAAAFKDAAGVGEIAVTAEPTDDGYLLNGVIPWASNLYAEGIAVLPVITTAGHKLIVTVPTDASGLDVKPMKNLLALDATASGFTKVTDVHVPATDVLSDDVPGFLASVSAPFLLMQASFCLGLSAAALTSARPYRRSSNGVFTEDFDDREREFERLSAELTRLAADPAAAGRRDVLQVRLDTAHLAQAAAHLELTVVGGRGYVADSPTARRFREASFLPVQSPTEGHLRSELRNA